MAEARVEGLHQVSFEEHGSTVEIVLQSLSDALLGSFLDRTARPGHPPTFHSIILQSSNSGREAALTFLVLEGGLAERLLQSYRSPSGTNDELLGRFEQGRRHFLVLLPLGELAVELLQLFEDLCGNQPVSPELKIGKKNSHDLVSWRRRVDGVQAMEKRRDV